MKHPLKAFLPFIVFLSLYMGVGIYLTLSGDKQAFYQFPAPSAALVGFFVALLLGFKNMDKTVKTFAKGVGQETIVLMCLIFLLAGAFSAISSASGATTSTVNLGLTLLPDALILPGLFLVSCVVSFSMGTSMGTIGAVVPIAIGISAQAGLPLPLTISTVVGGAMFGDNLSIISDTTIAATYTQGCNMRDKMKENLKLALPAAALVTTALFFLSEPSIIPEIGKVSFLKTLPYALVLVLALSGLNVVAVLMAGIASASLAGFVTGSLPFLEIGKVAYQGFVGMSEVFYLTILIAGLSALAIEAGALKYILSKTSNAIRNKRSAEGFIAGIAAFMDVVLANNTIAIIVSGELAKEMADRFQIKKSRSASLLDVFTCGFQGIIPHGAQLLLAGSLAGLSPFVLIPYAYYPFALMLFAVGSILVAKHSADG